MALPPSSSPNARIDRGTVLVDRGTNVTVLWLKGEHDVSTRDALSTILTHEITDGATDVVVDLREVQFLDVTTVGVFVAARELASAASRVLTLRNPSKIARRLLDLCGVELLEQVGRGRIPPAAALRSWVAVPAIPRSDLTMPTTSDERDPAPDPVGEPATRGLP